MLEHLGVTHVARKLHAAKHFSISMKYLAIDNLNFLSDSHLYFLKCGFSILQLLSSLWTPLKTTW